MDNTYVPSMRRVRLELARDPEHPVGSRSRGYDFIAPSTTRGTSSRRTGSGCAGAAG